MLRPPSADGRRAITVEINSVTCFSANSGDGATLPADLPQQRGLTRHVERRIEVGSLRRDDGAVDGASADHRASRLHTLIADVTLRLTPASRKAVVSLVVQAERAIRSLAFSPSSARTLSSSRHAPVGPALLRLFPDCPEPGSLMPMGGW